jgi:hypothetical protein
MTTTVRALVSALLSAKKPEESVFTRAESPIADFRGVWEKVCYKSGVGKMVCPACKADVGEIAEQDKEKGNGNAPSAPKPGSTKVSLIQGLFRAHLPRFATNRRSKHGARRHPGTCGDDKRRTQNQIYF